MNKSGWYSKKWVVKEKGKGGMGIGAKWVVQNKSKMGGGVGRKAYWIDTDTLRPMIG